MAAFLRALGAAAALPAAAAAVSLSSSSSASSSSFPSRVYSPFPSSSLCSSSSTPKTLAPATRNPSPRPFATGSMVSPSTELKNPDQRDGALPELLVCLISLCLRNFLLISMLPCGSANVMLDVHLEFIKTEFMVDMKCEGCVSSVKSNLQKLDGIKNVDVDLSNQVVRVLGSLPVKTMLDALEQTGRSARLIGQGNPNDFLISAAVAEFKGPVIFGVARLAQVTMELARIEASFSGLSPGKHGWSINEFGDLTRGAASTGKVFNRPNHVSEKPLGDLGTLEADETGEATFSGAKEMLKVSELIGRSIVVYETEDTSDPGIAAAVVARSAGVGENYKKICTCDGVTIWESG